MEVNSNMFSKKKREYENERLILRAVCAILYSVIKEKRLLFTRECTVTKKVLLTDQWER